MGEGFFVRRNRRIRHGSNDCSDLDAFAAFAGHATQRSTAAHIRFIFCRLGGRCSELRHSLHVEELRPLGRGRSLYINLSNQEDVQTSQHRFASCRRRSAADARTATCERAGRRRRAIATVELAICLPVLSLIVFGSIQATNLIFLQHATTAAAYEGSLEMAKSNATNSSVQSRIQQVLDAREVVNTTIRILPAGTDITRTPAGTLLTLEVVADVRPNLSLFGFIAAPNQVTGRIVSSR